MTKVFCDICNKDITDKPIWSAANIKAECCSPKCLEVLRGGTDTQ